MKDIKNKLLTKYYDIAYTRLEDSRRMGLNMDAVKKFLDGIENKVQYFINRLNSCYEANDVRYIDKILFDLAWGTDSPSIKVELYLSPEYSHNKKLLTVEYKDNQYSEKVTEFSTAPQSVYGEGYGTGGKGDNEQS